MNHHPRTKERLAALSDRLKAGDDLTIKKIAAHLNVPPNAARRCMGLLRTTLPVEVSKNGRSIRIAKREPMFAFRKQA